MPFDGLHVHHAPQKHVGAQVIDGYDKKTGPSIALPEAEHRKIPNQTGAVGGSTRGAVALAARDLRKYTGAPNGAIKQLVDLAKKSYDLKKK